MAVVRVVGDALHLAHVHVVRRGRDVHLDVPLARPVGRLHRIGGVPIRAAVRDDDGDVLHAAAVSSSVREDVIVSLVDRFLRVTFYAGGPEAERVQNLLFAGVRVQIELHLSAVGVGD